MCRYYPGELVAEHINGGHLAYAINTPGKNVGVVRVLNRKSDERILIKVGTYCSEISSPQCFGSGFRGLLEPDSGAGSRGLKKMSKMLNNHNIILLFRDCVKK